MIFYFFSLGFFSLLNQVVLLRELSTWLGGNELFYALGLGFWLLFAGLGSLVLNKNRLNNFLRLPCRYLMIIFTFLSPIVLVVFRYISSRVIPVGQIPGIGASILIIILTLFLPAFLSGSLFYLGTKKWTQSTRAYLWETVGFFISGLVFTFLLSKTSFPLPKRINYQTLRWRYSGIEKVVYSKGSQLIVSEQASQKSIFSAGHLFFNSQPSDFDQQAAQVMSSCVLEGEHNLTGLVSGNLHLANFLSDENVFSAILYLFSDSEIYNLQENYLNQSLKPELSDSRLFFKKNKDQFDLILLDPGQPSNLFNNRYYTIEFFKDGKTGLTEKGIFGLIFDMPVEYQSEEALEFGRVIYKTFDEVFANTDLLIIEGRIILIGSEKEISYDLPDSSRFLDLVLTDPRRKELKKKLSGGSKINTVLHPVAYFDHHLFWQTMFSFQLPKVIRHLVWLIPISLILILFDLAGNLDEKKFGLFAALSGFILMGLETSLLFIFQTRFGNLYTYFGLIMGTVLLGMTVGVKIIEIKKLEYKLEPAKTLLYYLPIGGFLLLDFWQGTILIWLALSLILGLVGGLVFSLSNRAWLKKSKNQTFVYACDLFGSFWGAVLVSTVILPKFGLLFFLLILIIITAVPRFKL